MSNPRNNVTIIGRLAADPRFFENRDGSKTVRFTVFADHDWTNKDGQRGSEAIEAEAFVRAGSGVGPYSSIHKGDLVAVDASLRQDRYTDRNGQDVYKLKVAVDSVAFLEPRSVTQARLAGRAQAAETQAPAPVQQPAPMTTAPAQQPAPQAHAYAGQAGPGQEYLPFT